jgi:hypothetical protein
LISLPHGQSTVNDTPTIADIRPNTRAALAEQPRRAHPTFVEPASWLGWGGEDDYSKCSPEERRLPKKISEESSRLKQEKQDATREKAGKTGGLSPFAPIRIEIGQCG